MQFPSRDLTNQYISLSYQNVVQIYDSSGTASYFLDGYGYVITYIPSGSIGQAILTADQTASAAISASYAPGSPSISASHADYADNSRSASYALISSLSDTASYALLSMFSDTASLSSYSDYAGSSSFALTASYSYTYEIEISSSWASASLSASHSENSDNSIFSNTASVSITSIFSDTASLSGESISSSYAVSASYAPTNHVEFGIISGSDFIGNPKYFDIIYINAFQNDIYTVSIIGDEARVWSTSNRSTTGFTINSNSNTPLSEMVMWRVEG